MPKTPAKTSTKKSPALPVKKMVAASKEKAEAPTRPNPKSQKPLAPARPSVAKSSPAKRSAKPEKKPAQKVPVPEAIVESRPPHQAYLDPGIPSMRIVHIASEMAPVSKVGGLADVVFGLTHELAIRGNEVEIILPKYSHMRYEHIHHLCVTHEDLWVPWFEGAIRCTVYFGFVYGRKCFFIEPHSADRFFNRGKYYGEDDDLWRFAFFSRAALEFLLKSGKRPDIIHCHDWHTGLVPVLFWEMYAQLGLGRARMCYTIHNFKHQGLCGTEILQATGLHRSGYFCQPHRLEDNHYPGALNLMKGGIVYSNFVTTVSSTHAGEARDGGQGFGMEPTLRQHTSKFGGVLNGIDYGAWNPETDPYIPANFSLADAGPKQINKTALQERFNLTRGNQPIVAHIGRLDPQKGLELVRHAIYYCVEQGAQFVLLGSSPDPAIDGYFHHLKHELQDNPNCHLEIGFDEELAHLIYAGADLMIVPSRFEPCGLTQLIAMRYGTIPVVRSVGGLADTVFDVQYSDRDPLIRNGYVFHHDNHQGLESALSRAFYCFNKRPEEFQALRANAMRADNSWNIPGQHYLNIYNYIREKS